jgi:hypothetical protein
MVDLSTSHPGIFAPLLAELGMPVRAVLDPVRAADFCQDHPSAVAVGCLAELADACDVVMLLGRDWDERPTQLETLAVHGVPVFVDKPMAGTAGELRALADLPLRIDGGSALRVAPEAVRVRESGRRPAVVDVTCTGHPFYYGVHAVALATAVLGPGLVSARGLSGERERSIEGVLDHVSGAEIRVSVATSDTAGGFAATVDGELRIEPAAGAFYPALLRDTMTRLTTAADPRPGAELVECELALLALAWSLTNDGAPVALGDVPATFHPWRGSTGP